MQPRFSPLLCSTHLCCLSYLCCQCLPFAFRRISLLYYRTCSVFQHGVSPLTPPIADEQSRGLLVVLVVADMHAPGCAVALFVHFEHGEVRHKTVARRAVPVFLSRLEEHAVARANDLDWPTASLAEANTLRDVDRLAVGVRVPCRSCARREVNVACRQSRAGGWHGNRVNVDRAGEPGVRPRCRFESVPGDLHVVSVLLSTTIQCLDHMHIRALIQSGLVRDHIVLMGIEIYRPRVPLRHMQRNFQVVMLARLLLRRLQQARADSLAAPLLEHRERINVPFIVLRFAFEPASHGGVELWFIAPAKAQLQSNYR